MSERLPERPSHESRNLPARDDPEMEERAAHPSDEIELREVLGILRRRKGTILLFVLLALAGTGVLIHFQEPEYTARAVIRLEDTQRAMAGGLDRVAQERLMGRTAPDPLLSQLQILHSAQVLGETVDREGLRLLPLGGSLRLSDLEEVHIRPDARPDTLHLSFGPESVRASSRWNGEAEAPWGAPLELSGVRFTLPGPPGVEEVEIAIRHRERAIEDLRENLRARPREETDVVEVEYTSTDPVLAMRVVNTTVEAFRERNVQSARQHAQRRRIFLEEQMEQADSLMADAQRTMSDFRSRERVFSSQEWFVAQQTGLLNLEARREELAADRSMYRQILDGLREAEAGEVGRRLEALVASPEIAGNPVVAGLFGQLVQYEAARDSLVSGPWGASRTNPDVQRVEEQITSTTGRLEGAIRSHLESLDARVDALDQLMARTSADLAALPEVEAEEARLVQRLRSVERTVDQLREEYQRARISEAVEAGQVEVIDFATVPLDPEGTGRALMLALGLMLGLMVGSGAAFLREALNTRIRLRDDMEETLRVPSIGVIPRLPANGRRLVGAARVRGLIGKGGGGPRGDGTGAGQGVGSELVTVSDGQSPHAEAFRTIRTNLLFSAADRSIRSLVVTSPTPEEGKTTTAANLAVAYAQQGMKVLLVDCDLRKARLHRMFGFPREPGLTDLVLEQAGLDEVVHDFPVEGLDVITSGAHPPNPSELVGGARMRSTLEALCRDYELVILDTPPLIAGPDAAILGSFCDGVLLVVRAGRTEREAGEQAVRQLHTVGARIVGAVLNDPDGELPRYSSYYAYQYEYYSSEG